MELLIGASFITAFIAGIAALFAPCCISVLLPAYLGSIFREKKTVILMTFIFFLGLLAVFMPLGLGAAALGQMFSEYHNLIYIVGSLLLLFLGISLLLGRHFSLPFSMHPKTNAQKVQSAGSVFGLGVFSGFATLCCAPVLAGALALSVLPGSVFLGGMYTLAYVIGMVSPLFIIAYFLDRTDFTKKFIAFRKQFSYSVLGKRISLTIAEMIAGFTFLFMGILILYLAQTSQLAMGGNEYQTMFNIYMSNLTDSVNGYFGWVPWEIWIAIIIAALALIIRGALIKRKKYNKAKTEMHNSS